MKLNSAQLEAFFAVARTMNFTRAAETLHVTQSALSQRVAKLEDDLETTLFIRDRTSVRLTEAGHQVLRYCQVSDSVESELLMSLKGAQSGLSGVLRIAGFSSVNRSLVIPALRKMMLANNNLSLHMITKELWELADLLQRAEVDYLITNQKSESDDLENIFLGFEENILVRSRKFPEGEIYLDHDEKDPVTKSFFRLNGQKRKTPRMRYLDDVYGIMDGVKNGFGQAVLPRHLVEHEKDLEILERRKTLRSAVYLQFFRQPFYRKMHALVIHELQEYFREHLSQDI